MSEKKRPRGKRPTDPNQLAKHLVDALTGNDLPDKVARQKNPAAVSLGRLGGLKGGPARKEKLSEARRKEIAREAALARWYGNPKSHS